MRIAQRSTQAVLAARTQAAAIRAAAKASVKPDEAHHLDDGAEIMAVQKRSGPPRAGALAKPSGTPGSALQGRSGGDKPMGKARPVADPIELKGFKDGLQMMEAELRSVLPETISTQRFIATAIAAVMKNPPLLAAERNSLFLAVREAAEQRLMPDGSEGVILAYLNEATGLYFCRWHPMIGGLRKRLAENGVFVQSHIVCEHDEWDWAEGYSPMILHKPARLGMPRGNWLGAYAIFRRGGLLGELIHQEVMDVHQISAVKKVSKTANGLMWQGFEDQAWVKTVVRRGIKSVPILSHDVEAVVKSDDKYMDWDQIEAEAAHELEAGSDSDDTYNPLEDPTEAEIRAGARRLAREIDGQAADQTGGG